MADMTCARRAGYPMCETCTLAGLAGCASLGVPLPLVEAEKTRVEVKRVYPPIAPNGMTQQDLDAFRRQWNGEKP